jgi:hypothetical protein
MLVKEQYQEGVEVMFIHIGSDQIVRAADLIGIFDLSLKDTSKLMRQFLEHEEKKKRIIVIGDEESKSFVVTRTKLYFSPISAKTLKKRMAIPYSDIKIVRK